jgi:hypothetical protein
MQQQQRATTTSLRSIELFCFVLFFLVVAGGHFYKVYFVRSFGHLGIASTTWMVGIEIGP